ncbi:twin-arginine translocase TatA/TatE family subunit [Kordiimonas aquimaris]|uniref:twin-arginine translocase TatA/TatE family subunit n=1 Tax=Kordiimonas aquimaris TaxID=707591 RepID=UPI0021CFD5AE|nr:twin-arginine translocase TatA/TatE family subunit [Kordiimonas aquimaris]
MFPGWMQIALVALLIILLFGRGKISDLMGDVAKGITSFRKGLKEDPAEETDKAAPEAAKPVTDSRVIDGDAVKVSEKDKADA